MVLHSYDLAVIGDHLGGLAAAALSVKRGRRVVLFEDADDPLDRPMEYLNSICGGPEREVGLGRFFHDLGLSPFGPLGDDRIHFRPLHPPLQVILPGHRLNIYQDRVARNWEMEREFGEVLKYLSTVHEKESAFREKLFRFRTLKGERNRNLPGRVVDGTSRFFRFRTLRAEAEKENFSRFLAIHGLPGSLADVLAGEAQSVSRLLPPSMPWAVGMRAVQVLQGGLFQNAAGQSGIISGLKETFRRLGGDCRPLESLEGVDLQRTEAVHLHLEGGGKAHAGRLVIDLPLRRAEPLFTGDTLKGLQRKGLSTVAETWHFGLMRLEIQGGWKPECMGRHILVDPSAAPGSKALTLIVAAQPEGSAGAETGFALEVLALSMQPRDEEDLRKEVWDRLESIMPFLARGMRGEPHFAAGSFPRYEPQNGSWRSLESYYRTGRRPGLFRTRQLVFLRNEEYYGIGLAEGVLSGIQAVE